VSRKGASRIMILSSVGRYCHGWKVFGALSNSFVIVGTSSIVAFADRIFGVDGLDEFNMDWRRKIFSLKLGSFK
jgi:hypothetical protein